MAALHLCFSAPPEFELLQTRFCHPLTAGKTLHCVRGKGGGITSQAQGCFQWSDAVKALALLCCRAKLAVALEQPQLAVVRGLRGSAASSLDYAISKKPHWLRDMFGSDSSGNSLLRRIVRRSNSELKRPGPVELRLNESFLPSSDVVITYNATRVEGSHELNKLVRLLERHWQSADEVTVAPATTTLSAQWLKPFSRMLYDEMSTSLTHTDIFDSENYRSLLFRIGNSTLWKQRRIGAQPLLQIADLKLPDSARMGFFHNRDAQARLKSRAAPVSIFYPGVDAATSAIFRYLKEHQGYPLNLHYHFPAAPEIVQGVISGAFNPLPDLIVAGIGPAARLLQAAHCRHEYQPCMLLPSISNRVVSAGSNRNVSLRQGDYFFLTDEPTTALSYFHSLVEAGQIDARRVALHHAEPERVVNLLREHNNTVRSIQWFPHYRLYQLRYGCTLLDEHCSVPQLQEVLVLARASLFEDRETLPSLLIAIRAAWQRLRECSELRSILANELAADGEYMEYLLRCAGIKEDPLAFAA